MLEKGYYDKADTIIKSHGAMEASLIPIIQDIQSEYRYLPPELLSYVADQIGITEAKAFSVATFYENFSFEPKGKYVIKVCDGTACHVRKSTTILERIYNINIFTIFREFTHFLINFSRTTSKTSCSGTD